MKNILYILLLFSCAAWGQNFTPEIGTKKVHYLDTNFVKNYVEAFYIGCNDKKLDTIYYLKYDLIKSNNWEIYYDKKFKRKFLEYIHKGDTLTTTYYFK